MRDMKMAFMRRIERSAQQPNPHAATVMEQARMLDGGQQRYQAGLIWRVRPQMQMKMSMVMMMMVMLMMMTMMVMVMMMMMMMMRRDNVDENR